mmetsp:Transcript_8763/g.7836  ORF Transcript_8763/g.7836 Transcript_8763/m.7836 type:complete len:210 (+) Transcript_8763:149-778(+)
MQRARGDTLEIDRSGGAESSAYRKFDSKARLIVIFGIGFLLGICAILSLYAREFDSVVSLRPSVLAKVDPEPVIVFTNHTIVRKHVTGTNYVNTKKSKKSSKSKSNSTSKSSSKKHSNSTSVSLPKSTNSTSTKSSKSSTNTSSSSTSGSSKSSGKSSNSTSISADKISSSSKSSPTLSPTRILPSFLTYSPTTSRSKTTSSKSSVKQK